MCWGFHARHDIGQLVYLVTSNEQPVGIFCHLPNGCVIHTVLGGLVGAEHDTSITVGQIVTGEAIHECRSDEHVLDVGGIDGAGGGGSDHLLCGVVCAEPRDDAVINVERVGIRFSDRVNVSVGKK